MNLTNTHAEVAAAVAEYISWGWTILPVNRRTKSPGVPWKPYQTRWPTEQEMAVWFKGAPNICVLCGKPSGITVIDADNAEAGFELMEKHPTGMVVKTARGLHLYYKYNPVAKTTTSPGLDIRSDGGILILPPSIHETGVRYEWLQRDITALGEFPAEILAAMPHSNGVSLAAIAEAGAPVGQRNQAATALIGQLVGARGMDPQDAIRYMKAWNCKNSPALDDRELMVICNSIIAREMLKPRVHVPELLETPEAVETDAPTENIAQTGGEIRPEAVQRPVPAPVVRPPSLKFVKWHDFAADPAHRETRWIIPGWLPYDTIMLVVSPPAVGKTWLLDDMAVSVSTGNPFLRHIPTSMTGNVLLLQQEDAMHSIMERISLISMVDEIKTDDPGDGLMDIPTIPHLNIHVHTDRAFRFESSMAALEQSIAEIRPLVVFIDPLYYATDKKDFMLHAIDHMAGMKVMRDKYHVSFVIAHHAKKGTSEFEHSREDSWGTQFLNAFLESSIYLRQARDRWVDVHRSSKQASAPPECRIRWTIESPNKYDVEIDEGKPIKAGKEKAGDKKQTRDVADSELEKIILTAIKHGICRTGAIGKEIGKPIATTCRILQRLSDDGLIVKDGKAWEIIETGEAE